MPNNNNKPTCPECSGHHFIPIDELIARCKNCGSCSYIEELYNEYEE